HVGACSGWDAGSRGGAAPAGFASCSSKARVTSRQTFLCSRQKRVSVEANVPFSKNLLAGGPPPQKGKYVQLSRHISTPRLISSSSSRNRAEATTASSESVLTFPSVKPPCAELGMPSNSGE